MCHCVSNATLYCTYTVPKLIDFPRYYMKCCGENVILRGIVHVVSSFPLQCMFYRVNLDCFSNRVMYTFQFKKLLSSNGSTPSLFTVPGVLSVTLCFWKNSNAYDVTLHKVDRVLKSKYGGATGPLCNTVRIKWNKALLCTNPAVKGLTLFDILHLEYSGSQGPYFILYTSPRILQQSRALLYLIYFSANS